MARVSLRDLTKRYGPVEAVAGVSLEVADGEFLVLLGPSGSGKSTILKLIAGIEVADEGEIWIGDERVDALLPRFRDVAMVFQSYALYPHMSVSANLAFPLRSSGLSRSDTRQRVEEVSALLGLTELLDRRPGQLSGGQQQRVALGRAIVRQPKVFLMDEPLSNLDAKLRARTRVELTRLHGRLGATTLYVTHDQVEAMTMGHRVAVIESGAIRQVDEPEELYEYPADLVVADFLGSPPMNVLPVTCSSSGGTLRLSGEGFALEVEETALAPRVRAAVPDGQGVPLVLGIRPEYMAVAEGGSVEAKVREVELLGSERVLWVTVGHDARVALRVPARVRATPGDRLAVGFDPEAIRLFDPASGRLLR